MKSNQPKPDPERKKQASELLKSADKLLHAGEFAEAMQEIEKALSIDPGNFYALAYKERILDAQAAPKTQKPLEKTKPAETPATPVKGVENKALSEKVRREEEARLRDEEAREETQDETRQKAQEKTRQKIQEEARRETQEEVRQ